MSEAPIQKEMLITVARALGPELLERVTFVGGCTTALLLTDEFTIESVRGTKDVDLIVQLMGKTAFHKLQETLRAKGFKEPSIIDNQGLPICAMNLGELRVDFMPDDPEILGFSNRWYKDAIKTAFPFKLDAETTINLISPVYFVATKLEAYKGRGKNDPLESHDIEDMINLVDGREELLDEFSSACNDVKTYISTSLKELIIDKNFEYALQSHVFGNNQRLRILFERFEQMTKSN